MQPTTTAPSTIRTSTSSAAVQPGIAGGMAGSGHAMSDKRSCLTTFECWNDYVYDVQWSPSHPSMFGAVDGQGKLSLFDLTQDKEAPICTVDVTPATSTGGVTTRAALSRLKFDKEGKRIAVGSSDGYVSVYELGRKYQPVGDEYHQLQRVLSEWEQQSAVPEM